MAWFLIDYCRPLEKKGSRGIYMKSKIHQIVITMLDRFLPQFCQVCERPSLSRTLCTSCRGKIKFLEAPFCSVCGETLPTLNTQNCSMCGKCSKVKHDIRKSRSLALYESPMKDLILFYKFQKKTYLVNEFILLIEEHFSDINFLEYDYFIPVPLHARKWNERKFNQALLLAERLGEKYKKRVLKTVLFKTLHTLPQSELKREERLLNLKKTFCLKNSALIENKKILLIDDIQTTRSTLIEWAKTLNRGKHQFIDSFTLALTGPCTHGNHTNSHIFTVTD